MGIYILETMFILIGENKCGKIMNSVLCVSVLISISCCIVLLFNQVYENKSLVQHNSDIIKELLNKNQKDENDLSQEIFYEYGKSIKKLFSLLSLGITLSGSKSKLGEGIVYFNGIQVCEEGWDDRGGRDGHILSVFILNPRSKRFIISIQIFYSGRITFYRDSLILKA